MRQIISQIRKICQQGSEKWTRRNRRYRELPVIQAGCLSWTINRQGQFKAQKKDEICVWVYSLFTDVPGDYVKKPMKRLHR